MQDSVMWDKLIRFYELFGTPNLDGSESSLKPMVDEMISLIHLLHQALSRDFEPNVERTTLTLKSKASNQIIFISYDLQSKDNTFELWYEDITIPVDRYENRVPVSKGKVIETIEMFRRQFDKS